MRLCRKCDKETDTDYSLRSSCGVDYLCDDCARFLFGYIRGYNK